MRKRWTRGCAARGRENPTRSTRLKGWRLVAADGVDLSCRSFHRLPIPTSPSSFLLLQPASTHRATRPFLCPPLCLPVMRLLLALVVAAVACAALPAVHGQSIPSYESSPLSSFLLACFSRALALTPRPPQSPPSSTFTPRRAARPGTTPTTGSLPLRPADGTASAACSSETPSTSTNCNIPIAIRIPSRTHREGPNPSSLLF